MTGRRAPLWGYLTALAISVSGTRLSMIAIPWFVLTSTGSATKTGLVAFAEMAPLVLLQFLSGPYIDRIGARRMTLTCSAVSAVVVGIIPLLHVLDLLTFPLLLVLVALAGAARGPGDAAGHAMLPLLVEHAHLPTERVTGLAGAVERTASLAGAASPAGWSRWSAAPTRWSSTRHRSRSPAWSSPSRPGGSLRPPPTRWRRPPRRTSGSCATAGRSCAATRC